ncbi:MAG TPA: DNA polymerase III subunit delta [Corynebacterium stationis]|uniref:DNA polymerase III subunit delta n=1 Tax=Corynebacterium stationis TaxID=1705 RepID=UPI001DC5A2D5|nr:DNA polymerase III subunit delta [Corynebacterium stationis]HJG63293.1 DNA polymerase III subunit delta [Corynebacterium stationis]
MVCMEPVHLIVGDDEFLAERARRSIQKAVAEETGEQPELKILRAAEVTGWELIEATSPSLFGETRVIVIADTERVGSALIKLIVDAAKDPAPGMTMVINFATSRKNLKNRKKPPELMAKMQKLARVHEVFSLYDNEVKPWATREFAAHGIRPTPDVVDALLSGVGSDLRALAAAISQLVADTGGNVTRQTVQRYYVGVAEVENWDIADAAVAGRAGEAIATCRRALQLGAEPVGIAAALANKVGVIARLYTARGDKFSLAKQSGLHPYVAEKTAPIARRWSGDNISKAVIIVSDLDGQVKSLGRDGADYAVEAAVRQIAQLAR